MKYLYQYVATFTRRSGTDADISNFISLAYIHPSQEEFEEFKLEKSARERFPASQGWILASSTFAMLDDFIVNEIVADRTSKQ